MAKASFTLPSAARNKYSIGDEIAKCVAKLASLVQAVMHAFNTAGGV